MIALKRFAAVSFLIFLAVVVALFHRPRLGHFAHSKLTLRTNAPISRAKRLPAPSPTDVRGSFSLAPPLANQAAIEAGKNPHEIPSSILKFAAAMAPKMRIALQSENSARSLFSDLETCLKLDSTKISRTAQAICLSNARELARKFSSLNSSYDKLVDMTDPEVVKLVNFAER